MKQPYINFCLTFNQAFMLQAQVTMGSILHHLSNKYYPRVFLFVNELSEQDLEQINLIKNIKDCEIVFYQMKDYEHYLSQLDQNQFDYYANVSMYYRWLMMKILPHDVEKCLYLDCDMLVVKDLTKVYDSFINNDLIACVKDVCLDHTAYLSAIPEFANWVTDPYKYSYFNSGFFILNIPMAKELKIFDRCFDVLSRLPKPKFPDQDVLNAVISQQHNDKVIYLPLEYNYRVLPIKELTFIDFFTKEEIIFAAEHPTIVHYLGSPKPWQEYIDNKFFFVYWDYVEKFNIKGLIKPVNKYHLVGVKKIFNIIPILGIYSKNSRTKYKLFNLISIFWVYKTARAKKYLLFKIIPLYRYKELRKKTIYSILGIRYRTKLFKR